MVALLERPLARWLIGLGIALPLVAAYSSHGPSSADERAAYAACLAYLRNNQAPPNPGEETIRMEFPDYDDLIHGPTVEKNATGYTIGFSAAVFEDRLSIETPLARLPYLCAATKKPDGSWGAEVYR